MKKYTFILLSLFIGLTVAHSQENSAQLQLKVMAYNIHHANPPSRPDSIDIDAIVAVIQAENPDLVALQEVDVRTKRAGGVDQAKAIADRLGMHYFFAKAIDFEGGEYGQAVLSRFPISDETVHQLPAVDGFTGEQRIMANVHVQLPTGKQLIFGTAHLDAQRDPANRLLQVQTMNLIAAQADLPIVIGGDFNMTADSEPFQILRNAWVPTCEDCPFTIPVVNPRKTIDFLLHDGHYPWRIVSHHVVDEQYASDHLPVVAVLELED